MPAAARALHWFLLCLEWRLDYIRAGQAEFRFLFWALKVSLYYAAHLLALLARVDRRVLRESLAELGQHLWCTWNGRGQGLLSCLSHQAIHHKVSLQCNVQGVFERHRRVGPTEKLPRLLGQRGILGYGCAYLLRNRRRALLLFESIVWQFRALWRVRTLTIC